MVLSCDGVQSRRAMPSLLRGVRVRTLRLLVLILALPLASAGALPVWAQLVGVEAPHVCHCSLDHHDCVCPRCQTDPDAEEYLSAASLKGRCGDDEIAFGGSAMRAVLDAPCGPLLEAPSCSAPNGFFTTSPPGRDRTRPPTPPPRAA